MRTALNLAGSLLARAVCSACSWVEDRLWPAPQQGEPLAGQDEELDWP